MQPEQPNDSSNANVPSEPVSPPEVVQAQPVAAMQNPVPQQPTTPVVSGPVVSASPVPVAVPSAPIEKPKSHLGLILGIVGGGILLLVGGFIALYILVLAPPLQTMALATGFMTNITHDQAAAALVQAGGNEADKEFLQQAAVTLKGNTYKMVGSSYKSGGASNYLYTLSGGDKKYARVTIEKISGKREVTSFVFSANELKLVTATSSAQPTAQTQTSSQPSIPTTTTACFDANSFSDINPYPVDAYPDGRYVWTDNFFFKPDSTDYNYPDVMVETFARYKAFYQTNSGKQFTLTLKGEVFSTSPATTLANARAAKAKADLTSQTGIPADRIVIVEPTYSQNQDNAAARNVDITIQSPDSCITNKN